MPLITIQHVYSPITVPTKYIISVEDMKKKLANLNIHNAVGPDNLPNWI